MNDVLSATLLRRPVGLGRSNDRDDIRTLKTMLHRIGRLPEPEESFSGDFDTPLEKAVTGFQRDNGLDVDGRLVPGGETERALRRSVRNSPPAFAVRPGELTLSGRIGAGGDPAAEGTGAVARTLANLGFLAPRKAAEIGRGDGRARLVLENAVRDFQMSEALDPDGRLEPGGPTVTALRRAASNQMSGGEGDDVFEGGEDNDIVAPQRPEPDSGDVTEESKYGGGPAGLMPDDDVEEEADDDRQAGRDDPAQEKPAAKKPEDAPQPEIEWQQVIPIQVEGSRDFKVKGPIRVEMDSPAFGADGLHYFVRWLALDARGRVMPEVRNPDSQELDRGHHAIRKTKVYEPPFDNPHGFRVEIRIPPQQRPHGNSPGASLRIFAPKGGVLK